MKLPFLSVVASLTVFTPSRINETSAPASGFPRLSRTVPVIVASDLLEPRGKCVAGDERHQRDDRQTKTKRSSHAKTSATKVPLEAKTGELVQARRL